MTLIGSTGFMDSGELIAEVDKASGLGAIVAFDVNACTPSTPPWSRIDVGELLEKIATKYVLLRHAVYDEIHHVLILVPGSTEVEAEETVQGNENALADAETAEVEPETGDDGADASEPETDYGEGEEASGEEDAAAELPDENPGTIEDQEDSDD